MLSDVTYMARALELAERGRGTTSPNPMVGAVIVCEDGTIVGQGYHERAGGPHAEVRALDEAGERARGASLYCTLEPCCHTGRTGPCVERIVAAGIRHVFAATIDADPRVGGRGIEYLRDSGIAVTVGTGREEARRLNRAYFTFKRRGRPFVIMKAATSLDNRVAERTGERTSITAETARRHAHRVRAEVDAIGVGSETVLVDDPHLTVRDVYRARPLTRVVFDRRLRTPASARLFSTLAAGPVIIVTTRDSVQAHRDRAEALRRAGADLAALESGDLGSALAYLAEKEVVSLLLEGGVAVQTAAWQAGLVDAVHHYVAPIVLGSEGVPWLDVEVVRAGSPFDRQVMTLGRDTFTESHVHGID